MPGPRSKDVHHPAIQMASEMPTQQPPSPQPAVAASSADVQQTGLMPEGGHFDHRWMLQQEEVAMKLLAGQERLEALLRDSVLCCEFTDSCSPKGDFLSQMRSKWNCNTHVAESPATLAVLTPPHSARTAPPRKMKVLGGGLMRYSTTLPPQPSQQPSPVLQRLSPRLPCVKVVNSHHHELKNSHHHHELEKEGNTPKPSLHKPLDVDLFSPRNLGSNDKTLTNALSPRAARAAHSEDSPQSAVAETALNCQKAPPAMGSIQAKDQHSPEKKEPKDGVEELVEEEEEGEEVIVKKEKTFRMTQLTSNSVDGGGPWDARVHLKKMIHKQELKNMYKGGSKGSSFRSGSDVPLESRLSTFIKGSIYENAGTALVVVNAVFIGWQVQHFAKTHTSLAFRMPVEITFATLFLLEFLGKVYAWRWKLFDRGAHDDLYWNVFDLFVVSFMWLEISMELGIIPSSEMSSVSILRILRILRLVRVVKIMRTLKVFRELRLMILAISRGSLCLVWVIIVLSLAFYIFGVSLTQGANEKCPGVKSEEGVETELTKLCDSFGTLPKAILSLYAAMSGGISWIEPFNALYPLGPLYMSIFLFYTIFSIFAIANIITGIFVDSATQSSTIDHDSVIDAEMQKLEGFVQSIHKVFMDLDEDASGTISVSEFEQIVHNKNLAAYFSAMGLEITDVKSLIALMDRDKTGFLDIEEFLFGCLRLKGQARSLDLAKLSLQTEYMFETLEDICYLLKSNKGDAIVPAWHKVPAHHPVQETRS